jgi:hypothetical protein
MLDLGPLGVFGVPASVSWDLRHWSELLRHAGEGGVLPVLDLQPVIAPAGAVGALAVLGNQTLETHAAGGVEQVWPDLSLLGWTTAARTWGRGGDEDLRRRGGLTAGAAPSLPGGKVCR